MRDFEYRACMPALMAPRTLGWSLWAPLLLAAGQAADARCEGEEVRVAVSVASAGLGVSDAAIRAGWLIEGAGDDFVHATADSQGRYTFGLRRPVSTRSRWPAGYTCVAHAADLMVCAAGGDQQERCVRVAHPEGREVPIEIDVDTAGPSELGQQRPNPRSASVPTNSFKDQNDA